MGGSFSSSTGTALKGNSTGGAGVYGESSSSLGGYFTSSTYSALEAVSYGGTSTSAVYGLSNGATTGVGV
jgi:hypothetical protein